MNKEKWITIGNKKFKMDKAYIIIRVRSEGAEFDAEIPLNDFINKLKEE